MVMKNWKKIGKSRWDNIKDVRSRRRLVIIDNKNVKIGLYNGATLINRKFKTKTQALRYARAYMRKH